MNGFLIFSSDNPKFWVGQLATSLLIVASPLCLGASVSTTLMVLLAFALFSPFAAAYTISTGFPASVLAFQVLREATAEEFSTYAPQLLLCGALSVLILLLYVYLIRRPVLRALRLPRIGRVALGVLLVACLAKDIVTLGLAQGSGILLSRLERMEPVAPVIIFERVQFGHGIIPDRSGILSRYTVEQEPGLPEDQVCVLVVGESARKRALGLYSPEAGTTPRLQTRDLILFRNMTSCGTATIQSVPILLTGRFPDEGEILPFRHLDLVEAFRLAGFRTYWMSTQTADGEIASFISAFSVNADEKLFLNGRMEGSRKLYREQRFDGAMIDPFVKALSSGRGRKFIVVHMIGSHSPYSMRYPEAFTKWPVDPEGRKKMYLWLPPFDEYQRQQLDNAYLNSVLYSDWFVDQLIGLLAKRGGCAALFYLSDHGENTAEAKVMPAGHAVPTEDVINVPFFVWESPEMKRLRPDAFQSLVDNSAKPASLQDLFATACDLFRLKTPEADPSRRLDSPDYKESQRRVMLLDDTVITLPQ